MINFVIASLAPIPLSLLVDQVQRVESQNLDELWRDLFRKLSLVVQRASTDGLCRVVGSETGFGKFHPVQCTATLSQWTNWFCSWEKYIFAVGTNTYCNLGKYSLIYSFLRKFQGVDKLILQLGQIHFAVGKNTYCKLDKYSLIYSFFFCKFQFQLSHRGQINFPVGTNTYLQLGQIHIAT